MQSGGALPAPPVAPLLDTAPPAPDTVEVSPPLPALVPLPPLPLVAPELDCGPATSDPHPIADDSTSTPLDASVARIPIRSLVASVIGPYIHDTHAPPDDTHVPGPDPFLRPGSGFRSSALVSASVHAACPPSGYPSGASMSRLSRRPRRTQRSTGTPLATCSDRSGKMLGCHCPNSGGSGGALAPASSTGGLRCARRAPCA